MAKRVVFLGAGTGGTMAANRLAREMSEEIQRNELEIILLGDTDQHVYQPGFLYIALDREIPEKYKRSQQQLIVPGVQFVVDSVKEIQAQQRTIITKKGHRIPYDFLVVATGSVPNLDSIPGFRQDANSFYTLSEALRLREKIQSFKGGKVVMIVGVPHKCPVAPLEFMFMLDDSLRQAGKREDAELVYTYPIGRLHSLVPVAEWAEKEFEKRNIKGETFFNVESIDPANHTVFTLEGEEVKYDLLIGIPPHEGAPVIRNSGLGDAEGWLPTDPKTLKLKGNEHIYVLGDATDLPISKAGSTAHYQSEVVARNLIHELRGEPPTTLYNGKVFCFIESGLEEATHITFDYRTPPQPAKATTMTHMFKLAFNEMYWLSLRGLI
ncbi:NAD(P)/FAD-dependent oxidoreductase [Fodinisporobacter ferrooxydans]|uniref:NAD(P)/FAD-dependent oxidoreductase n=1 Tax=Fodinisporobacter ferrooxydans TaxID=2901836 RepID=A0ABY4CGR4_9BACL|nr:NAD(P)/FAD-dependent oxidoreductase [Alicyclobacillaceae bacterium MYW30-H2]